jgi:hypothetical protein
MKALVLTATVVLASPVVAEQSCQFQLEHDLVISPTQVIYNNSNSHCGPSTSKVGCG